MSNREVIDYLKKSPVFASSLGSKELFHSNIWAYLIEQDARYLKVFFKDFVVENYSNSKKEVYREKLNMDLIIRIGSDVFVIENKIKSLPREDQLRDYEGKMDNDKNKEFYVPKEKRHFCLTGIPEDGPKFLKKPNSLQESWEYVNYKKISDQLKEITMGIILNEETKHFRFFALEYAEMINNLSDLLSAKEHELKDVFYFPQHYENDDYKDIREELRIDDILQKINADQFTTYAHEQLDKNNLGVQSKTGYTNQRSLSEFYYLIGNEKDEEGKPSEHLKFGVQIQNTMFRWFAEVYKPKITKDIVFEKGKEIGWFSEKNKKGWITTPIKQLGEKETSMTKSSCMYQPMFVYQCFTIKEGDCSIGDLANTVVCFMKKAKETVDEYAKKLGVNPEKR